MVRERESWLRPRISVQLSRNLLALVMLTKPGKGMFVIQHTHTQTGMFPLSDLPSSWRLYSEGTQQHLVSN